MKKEFVNIEDFVSDESFRSWVTHSTPELDHYWQTWLKDHPDKHTLVKQSRDLIRGLEFQTFQAESGVKERIFAQIEQETKLDRKRALWRDSIWLKAAAVVLLLLTGLALWRFIGSTNSQGIDQFEGVQMVHLENAPGQRTQHTLPDGSIVHLNAGSSLSYPESFLADTRLVQLSGEAYFEVMSDAKRPFKVQTSGIEVVVLGTQFNVNTRLDQPAVALVEGKVRLQAISTDVSLEMSPSQMATFDKENGTFALNSFEPREVTGWKDGYLTFRKASFEEVVEKLHAWYGVEVHLLNQPTTSDWSYTANFKQENLENVLLSMSSLRPFQYEVRNDSLILSF